MTNGPNLFDEKWKRIESLVRDHADRAFRIAVRVVRDRDTALDVVQDAIVSLHTASRRGTEIDNLEAYYFRAVFNTAVNRLRKSSESNHSDTLDHSPIPPDAVSDGLESRQTEAIVAESLAQLPEKQCEALMLRFFAGLLR